MKRRINIWTNIDWLTVILYLVLVFLGWINIYASKYNESHKEILDFSQIYGKQLVWIYAAIFVAFVILLIDSKFYSFFAYLLYGLIIFSLLLVLLFGREIHGTRSWFEFGFFRIQPTEFAKFATSLALAKYLSTYNLNIHKLKSLFIISVILAAPAALIILQRDTGSALVYVAFIFVLYREGLSGHFLLLGVLVLILFILSLIYQLLIILIILLSVALLLFWIVNQKAKEAGIAASILAVSVFIIWGLTRLLSLNISFHFIILAGLGISSVFYILWAYRYKLPLVYLILSVLAGTIIFSYCVDYMVNDVLEKHQRKRIYVLLGIEHDIKGAGYNVNQSKIAIGSGGFSGKGFLKGTQTKFDFVPEQSTDFIFCTVGEEWGFIGATFVILLLIVLLLRIIYLAERQRSTFSRVFGYCVVSLIFVHIAINIGMTIGLAPVIGIPLPFFSYGGSSLWGFTILLFIFLRLDASKLELLG